MLQQGVQNNYFPSGISPLGSNRSSDHVSIIFVILIRSSKKVFFNLSSLSLVQNFGGKMFPGGRRMASEVRGPLDRAGLIPTRMPTTKLRPLPSASRSVRWAILPSVPRCKTMKL